MGLDLLALQLGQSFGYASPSHRLDSKGILED